jgi:hypothetical protein
MDVISQKMSIIIDMVCQNISNLRYLGMVGAMLSVDDKVDEDDFDNDIKEKDIVDDEYYKEKEEEDKDHDDEDDVDDDDDDKVVKLVTKNE